MDNWNIWQILNKILLWHYLAFQSFDYERNWNGPSTLN